MFVLFFNIFQWHSHRRRRWQIEWNRFSRLSGNFVEGYCSVLRWAFHRVRIESSYINALCIIHWSCRGKCDHCFVSQLPLQLCVPLRRLLEGLWSKSNVLMVSACSHVSSELCLITIFTKSDRVWFVNTKHPIVFPFSQSCLSIGHSPPPSTRFFFYSFLIINIKLEAEIATKLLNVTSANPFSQTGCFLFLIVCSVSVLSFESVASTHEPITTK